MAHDGSAGDLDGTTPDYRLTVCGGYPHGGGVNPRRDPFAHRPHFQVMERVRLPTIAAVGVRHPSGRAAWGWRLVQVVAVLGLFALIAALVRFPTWALPAFWSVAVPLVPLVLLVQPVLWRNVCPFATLNQWTGRRSGGRSLGSGAIGSGVLTLATFALALPARHLLFDGDGLALAVLLTSLVVVALLSGVFIRDRGGFCHLMCPVLPAERLYGLAPVIPVPAARCDACSVCTPRGCPELAGDKALPQLLGPARKTNAWTRTPWGFGLLAFPGLVAGFFLLPAVGSASVFSVYGFVWGCALASWAFFAALVSVGNFTPRKTTATAAALAFMIYYWFAVPGFVSAIGAPPGVTALGRLALMTGALLWWTAQQRAENERT